MMCKVTGDDGTGTYYVSLTSKTTHDFAACSGGQPIEFTLDGLFATDSGSSTLNSGSQGSQLGQISAGQFVESFDTSNGVAPTPTTTTTTPPPTTTPAAGPPATKQDCMNGGYAKYGYKNQGQCIAAVNHTG